MIAYYIHHQGAGHLHRAQAVAAHWRATYGEQVTGLSSLTRPLGWTGPWVQLPRDDSDDRADNPTASGQLHWVPLRDPGLRRRMSIVGTWLESARPRVVVVDVSVEISVLVRLHGVPVVTVVLPGRRNDMAHLVGFRVSDGLVGCWPPDAGGVDGASSPMLPGMSDDVSQRVAQVGGISRFPVATPPATRTPGPPRCVVLQGRGGDALTDRGERELNERLPGWQVTVLGGRGTWVEDPSPLLGAADVVVTGAGQGSLADVAALRRPAVVVAAPRPHDEQVTTARTLAAGRWPVLVADPDDALSADLLVRAAQLPGQAWSGWVDGHGVDRLAAVVDVVAQERPSQDAQAVREAGP